MLPTRLTEGAEGLLPPFLQHSLAITQRLDQLETSKFFISTCKIQAALSSNHLDSSIQETENEPYSNRGQVLIQI